MNKKLKILLLSLLAPGLGYVQNGDKKSFYKTIILFFGVLVLSVALRLFTNFWGLAGILVALTAIYVFAAIHAAFKLKAVNSGPKNTGFLKLCFAICFLLLTALSFANRRTAMGFDIMSMDVPAMQPTLLQGDKFLVDTWADKEGRLTRGAIVIHSFNGQKGLYLNRIIAMEGDKIEIANGIVFINRQPQHEPYVLAAYVTKPQSKDMQALVIPKDHYFVMGDNRDASFGDSRFSGTITKDNIVGKATDIISSHDKSRLGKTIK